MKKVSSAIFVLGYIFAVLGGLIGLIMGLSIVFGKEKAGNGIKVLRYDEASRKQAKILTAVSIVFIIFWRTLGAILAA